MSAIQIVGGMVAGLGLFFMGMTILTSNLRQLTGRRFRLLLERWTRYPLLSAVGGALLGATMQTGSAITYILVGMISAGMLTVQRSLPVRLGASMGTATMVFVATLDIQTFILFLLGISGIAITQSRTSRPLLSVLFGGGLLFFGLKMVGSGAGTLTQLPWFYDAVVSVNGAPLTAFGLGIVLSIMVQSPQSVAILAIAMTSNDVLSTWTTMAIIYGSNFGGGISTYFMTTAFKGTSRQIMMFQMVFNLLTGVVLLGLYFVELWTGAPLVHALVTSIGSDVSTQMALVYLVFNVFGALMMFTFRGPILRAIEGRWPPLPEENLGKLEFLHDLAIDTPDLALDLAAKEQRRFFALLAGHLDALRLPEGQDQEQGETTARTLDRLHVAISEALSDLGDKRLDVDSSERLIALVTLNRLLGTLHSSLTDFCVSVRAARASERLGGLAGRALEAMDALLLVAIDGFNGGDEEDMALLLKATQDRSEKMRSIRRRFMKGDEALTEEERLDLVGLTSGLERTIWVLHEFVGEVTRRADRR